VIFSFGLSRPLGCVLSLRFSIRRYIDNRTDGGRMSKQIIFCADGTWNGPGDADTTDIDSAAQQDPVQTGAKR